MAYDIGPKIGMDGEAEFRKSLQNINQQLKTLGSEMKAVTSAFADGDKSEEALAAQTDVLNRQIDAQQKKLEELQKGLDASAQKYGENDTRTLKWAQSVNNATADLNKLKSQLAQAERGMDDLGDATEDAGDAADNAGGKFGSFQVALGNLVASGIQAAISAVGNFVGALVNLDETTEEYRRAQGRLNTAFEAAGYGADTAQKAYQAFYGILGDTDTATEASQLLAQLADSEEDVVKWTEIAAGVSGTFGDSLPIEGLIEAANETAKVGEVTGTLANALNWVGISEDEFNTQLAACSTEAERNQLIMNTLAGQYDEASEAFYRNNEALVAARNAQAQMDASLARVGESIASIKSSLLTALMPAIETVSAGLADFLESIDTEALAENVSSFVNTIIENGPTIISIVAGIAAGFAAWKITSIIQSVVTALSSLVPALTGATAAQTGLNTAMAANPIGIIVTAITSLVTIIMTLWTTNEDFRNAVTEIWENIKAAFVGAWEAIKTAWEAAQPYFEEIWSAIKAVFTPVAEVLGGFFSGAWNAITAVWDAAVGFFTNIWNTIEGIFSVVESVLSGDFEGAWKAIQDVFSGWSDYFSGLWEDVTGAFADAWNFFTNLGEDIVNGIREGIENVWNGLVDWFEGIWNNLFGGRKATVEVEERYTSSRVDGSHAGGLSYVPFDGYIAELHKGEMVLTKTQSDWLRGLGDSVRAAQTNINRSMAELSSPELNAAYSVSTAASGGGAAQYQDSTANVIAAAVQAALQGAAVYLNGRRVGNLITQQQNASAVARGQSQVYL